MTAPVVRSAWVARSVHDTFRIFTDEIGAWWPLPTHGVFGAESGGLAFDGDRLVERAVDGREAVWGAVTAWEPPTRVAIDWHPGRPDDQATTVEISFEESGDGTRVVIEHHGWERLGPDAIERRRQYMRPNAWGAVLDHFGDATEPIDDRLDALREAQHRFVDAAVTALTADRPAPPDEWCAREVLAHVALNDLAMIRVCQALVHGVDARFTNDVAQSPDAIARWLESTIDDEHLLARARSTATQLSAALGRLSTDQLDAPVPCLLTHDGSVVLDGERPWGALAIDTQTQMHLPAHTEQLATLAGGADGE